MEEESAKAGRVRKTAPHIQDEVSWPISSCRESLSARQGYWARFVDVLAGANCDPRGGSRRATAGWKSPS